MKPKNQEQPKWLHLVHIILSILLFGGILVTMLVYFILNAS
ncbi:hypothetical protein [Bacillus sp. AK128]